MTNSSLHLVWLRRDLRLHDHAALASALAESGHIQPIFVFDTEILGAFPNPQDRRLSFIAATLAQLDAQLRKKGGGLLVVHGAATALMPEIAQTLKVAGVHAAEDYEPAAIARDKEVAKHAPLKLVKDQVIFSPTEILKDNGDPFKVYTPYSKVWRARLTPSDYGAHHIEDKGRYTDVGALQKQLQNSGIRVLFPERGAAELLQAINYQYTPLPVWPHEDALGILKNFIADKVKAYPTMRDMVAEEGTSRLSPYLRFGLVSVRECVRAAAEAKWADKWLSELIWREFYAMILYHTPISATQEWNPAYRGTLDWSYDETLFEAWKQGKTGYPVVDAAMRQLLETGWMHNRARMIVASFLTKDLLLDWRLGEAHFAQYLMDYDMASNIGGWQWAASTGTDAQPYFRIFNPTLQGEKFDPKGEYIRRYVPELAALGDNDIHAPTPLLRPKNYPAPVVEHSKQRALALAMFKKAQGNS